MFGNRALSRESDHEFSNRRASSVPRTLREKQALGIVVLKSIEDSNQKKRVTRDDSSRAMTPAAMSKSEHKCLKGTGFAPLIHNQAAAVPSGSTNAEETAISKVTRIPKLKRSNTSLVRPSLSSNELNKNAEQTNIVKKTLAKITAAFKQRNNNAEQTRQQQPASNVA